MHTQWLKVALALASVAAGCSGGGEDGADASSDSDTDTDADTDVDSDTDTDTDTDTDVDTDADADAGADGGSDTDADDAPLVGLYDVAGEDPRYGEYAGQAEIRDTGSGLFVAHVQTWDAADFEGDDMALAWEGAVTSADEPYGIGVTLERVGFMVSYGDVTRDTDPTHNAPIDFTASMERVDAVTLHGTFEPSDGPEDLEFTETWTWTGEPGADPIWRNERVAIDGHDPIGETLKETMFATYASFHALPEVSPYVGRPEFEAAMHTWIFDPTDFQFSRANPGVVRVIQKVVDSVSLAEARIRNRAYGQTLAEKQAVFEPLVPEHNVSETGMICYHFPSMPEGADQYPDGDSMLWTGVYAASQALRYLLTDDAEAFADMLAAIEGQLMCHDIAGTPGDFARTTRPHAEPLGDWVQGTGEYAEYDWLPGANNDMMKGYVVGFPWAYMALEHAGGDDVLRDRMVAVLDDLLDDSPLVEVLDPPDPGNAVSRGTLLLVKYMMTGDLVDYLEYLGCYPAISVWMVDLGNGAFYDYGASDWSGNHLIIQGLLTLFATADYAAGPLNALDSHADAYRDGFAQALTNLQHTRVGLYQLVSAGLGSFDTVPPELEEAIWTLREFPAPKESVVMDWRLNPSFCMSPFPNLPWKLDWTETNRLQSLTIYPLFEKPDDNYRWKSAAGAFERGAEVVENPGVDYLFAYWFARHYDIISETE